MKMVFAAFILCFSFSAFAAKAKKTTKSAKPAKVEAEAEEKIISPEEKDFFFLCESSKFAKDLKKS